MPAYVMKKLLLSTDDVMNGGENDGDRASRASSSDLSELTNTTLPSEIDDTDNFPPEDDEPDNPVKPSLRLETSPRLLKETVDCCCNVRQKHL